MANVHGFSPFQLALGQNPRLPSTFVDKLPALTPVATSKILADNLTALHKAREAFIQSESSEKLRRALNHNIRTSGDMKYLSGDSVFFKRANESHWRSPGKVLGQDGQQVLVKYGSRYVRVHPCRITLERKRIVQCTGERRNADLQDDIKPRDVDLTSDSEESTPEENTEQLDEVTLEDGNGQMPQQHQEIQPHEMQTEEQEPEVMEGTNGQLYPSQPISNVLKKSKQIRFKLKGDSNWQTTTLVSRSGKSTGKYPMAWNTKLKDGTPMQIDFQRDVDCWEELMEESNGENLVTDTTEIHFNELYLCGVMEDHKRAKLQELANWKSQQVYVEEEDRGRRCLSVRWVLTPKMIDSVVSTKARLCARGFEENQDFRTDSPTCSRIGIRFALTVISSFSWRLNSIDVKTAFLQGKEMERTVYLRPPKEAETNKVWRLKKCVYGLADASRYWYLRVKDVLINLGATICSVDQGMFLWFNGNILYGILVCHVDDMIWGGTAEFKDNVITMLKDKFCLGSENSEAFTYVGIEIIQNEDMSIKINQSSYIESIKPIYLSKERLAQRTETITDEEKSFYRGAIGQLNWVAGTSRPDISFAVCEASTKVNNATVADLLRINKTIKKLKSTPSYIKFPRLDLRSLNIKVFTDASFNNLPNGGSQGGQIVFLCDDNNKCCPLSWNSSRIRRVVRSTIGAETLSLIEGCDTALYISEMVSEISKRMNTKAPSPVNIEALTDNQSLFDTIHSTKQTSEKRLIVDISAVREMSDRNELSVTWIKKEKQLSDVLTKYGASNRLLLDILQTGRMSLE